MRNKLIFVCLDNLSLHNLLFLKIFYKKLQIRHLFIVKAIKKKLVYKQNMIKTKTVVPATKETKEGTLKGQNRNSNVVIEEKLNV